MPKLSLDRPFTYALPDGADAGTGSLVSVPFHGRTVKGWILGPAQELPRGRVLPVRTVRSRVRFFDPTMLSLLRWMSERYIAPLATVIERSHPPRVASEERFRDDEPTERPDLPVNLVRSSDHALGRDLLSGYGGPAALLRPGTPTWLRPLPGEEVDVCVAAVEACLSGGRSAIVLVPEADPIPATGAAVLDRFGRSAVGFLGGDDRERYRTWLAIREGHFRVVVGTRPAVFTPLGDLGLIWVSRDVHPGHREARSPYYHVREVAMARARLHAGACILASLAPSAETVAQADEGSLAVARPSRQVERASAPLVETTPPEAEDRSARLGVLLKRARSAALVVSRRGYGVARVCRSCGEPAACRSCRGPIVLQSGAPVCRVCGRPGECSVCGNGTFGIERGGAERVAEWAGRISPSPVEVDPMQHTARPAAPRPGRVAVGTAATVKDVGPRSLDLVAILDPDRALARPGAHAGEQALATWMEAAAWAAPRDAGGRVLVQTRRAGHAAIQALVRWEPVPFLRSERERARQAGFPLGHRVFRITGSAGLDGKLRRAGAITVLATPGPEGVICLAAVPPGAFEGFRHEVIRLADEGAVTRVEADPQL